MAEQYEAERTEPDHGTAFAADGTATAPRIRCRNGTAACLGANAAVPVRSWRATGAGITTITRACHRFGIDTSSLVETEELQYSVRSEEEIVGPIHYRRSVDNGESAGVGPDLMVIVR